MSLDPTGYFLHIKDILFGILVGFGILYCIRKKVVILGYNYLIVASIIILPMWGILVASAFDALEDESYAMGQMRSMFYILIFFYMVTLEPKLLLKLFWINGCVLSIVTIFLFLYGQFNETFYNILVEIGRESNNFKMALDREFLGVKVNGLYFTTGSFIILAFIYHLYCYEGRFKLILGLFLFSSMIFCGSRTPALIQILIFLIYLYDKHIIGEKFTRIFTLAAIISLFSLTFLLATEKDQNDVKYGNFSSYVEEITKDSRSFFLGAGVGSTFKASGNEGAIVAFTELSYMDVLRMYGIPIGSFFIILFFYPILIGYRNTQDINDSLFYKRFLLGYLLFLMLLGTNPLLLGSPGLTGLAIMMSLVNNTIIRTDDV